MSQTYALLLDAYRELNAKKLFWITLILSGLMCLVLFAIGKSGDGYQLLWFDRIQLGRGLSSEDFYVKQMFYIWGYKVWLTFGAGILAVVSTAGIFPDFIREGAIDTVLSKPIGRLRLFLTKWLFGLLFVLLQITIFTAGCFLAIGIRGGVWAFSMFWAIPLTVLFFSYLYGISVLVGVVTRSTIAALIVTILCWAPIILIDFTERNFLLPIVVQQQYAINLLERDGAAAYSGIDDRISLTTLESESMPEPTEQQAQADLDEIRDAARVWLTIQQFTRSVKTVLPKTGETTTFLQRFMYPERFEADYLDAMAEANLYQYGFRWDDALAVQTRTQVAGDRGVFWILGTSLIFEFVCLSVAAWVFCRRDY